VFKSVASPESATDVATFVALPTRMFPEVSVLESFALKLFQSVEERAPVELVLERPRERTCPANERPFEAPNVTGEDTPLFDNVSFYSMVKK
jgi:hypothetical protein